MFESFYGLTANPFRMSADEHFRYAHRTYVKAWSYLKYALEQAEGFVLITGRPGTGKTTLVRDILRELDDERVEPVNLVTNRLQGEELLRLVALEFGYPAQEYNKAMLLTRIERHALELNAQGRRVLVIVDEGQNLSAHGLEELRLLSNLQAGNRSLFQIVLIGQEELLSLIYSRGAENVRQRIVTSCRLEPMSADQIQGYVEHRLGIAGWDGDPSFDADIYPLLHRITQGVPREINLVAARLLLYGSLEQRHAFSKADLLVVLSELDQEQRLAFDQTALLAELREVVEATDTAAQSPPADVMPNEPESMLQSDDLCEDTIPDAEEAIELIRDQEPRFEQLPPMQAIREDDLHRPQRLFTDIEDLPLIDDGVRRGMGEYWRWFFYPLAIAGLLMMFLSPKSQQQLDDAGDRRNDVSLQAPLEAQAPNAVAGLEEISEIERKAPSHSTDAARRQTAELTPLDAPRQAVEEPAAEDSVPRLTENQPATDTSRKQAMPAQSPAAQNLLATGTLAPASLGASDTAIQKVATGQTGYTIEADKVYFLIFEQPGDTLDDRSELSLSRLTAWLHAHPSMVIVITGILEVGQEPMTRMREALSRAEQISARLISAGISSRRIFVEGGRQNNTPDGVSVSVKVTL